MASQHFQRKSSSADPSITTASLPDIIFMLLIFFMVTTVLRETEIQVETQLPEAEALTKIEQRRLITYVYIGPLKTGPNSGDIAVQIDDQVIDDMPAIRDIMYSKHQEEPRMIISMKVDRSAPMRVVNEVQQEFREAGTLRINYSSTQEDGGV